MLPSFSDFKSGMKLRVIGVHSHFCRIGNFLICWTFLVYLMEDDPVSKRARRAIGTVCDACGEKNPHHLDTISIVGADICAAQLATSAMMEQTGPSWWPHHGRPCRRPCCINWSSPAPVEAAVLWWNKLLLMQLMCIRISNAKGRICVASRLTEKQSL